MVEHHGELRFAFFRRRVHFLYLRRIYPRGLLADDVNVPFQTFLHHFGVQIMRRFHQHRVAQSAVQHFFIIDEITRGGIGRFRLYPFYLRGIDIAHGRHATVFDLSLVKQFEYVRRALVA